ncbi:hypothetical protein AMTR_s00066p00136500, partial [Amborella trichopoda]
MYPLHYCSAARKGLNAQERPSFNPSEIEPMAIIVLDLKELDPGANNQLEEGEIEMENEMVDDASNEEENRDAHEEMDDFDPALAVVEVEVSPPLNVIHQDMEMPLLQIVAEEEQDDDRAVEIAVALSVGVVVSKVGVTEDTLGKADES